MGTDYDIVILGAGPAGLTAGIYAARAHRSVLVLDTASVGGQTVLTDQVANYPGVAATSGRALSQTMAAQARAFGCTIVPFARVSDVAVTGAEKSVAYRGGERARARVVIVATGGTPRRLEVEGEERFVGRGISFCATCDGEFFTGRPIAVVGGGNSALEEAVSLSRFASRITIVHEFDHFQAEPWIVAEARANPKIEFLLSQRVLGFAGDGSLAALRSAHRETGEVTETPVEGCFVFIGYVPNSSMLEGQLRLSERGEVVTDDALRTSEPGVFAAGDVRQTRVRQITTAVADGTVAALSALDYLNEEGS